MREIGGTMRFNVEGDKHNEPFAQPEKPKTESLPAPELAAYEQQIQSFLDENRLLFTTFAGDVSLRFKMSDRFAIDLETGEVHLATKWFADRGFTKKQILWANFHELVHFIDQKEDPKGMEKRRGDMVKKAQKTGAVMMEKWEEVYSESDPDFIRKLKKQRPMSKKKKSPTLNSVETAAYQMHHRFYNILDDIYDNHRIARKAPRYESHTDAGKEITELYSKKLFPDTDYRGGKRHLQMMDKLIREAMVPGETVLVSDEVEAALNHPIQFQGKTYTAKEIIEQFIKSRGSRDTKVSQRDFVIEHTLEPLFQELLQRDLEEWQPEKPPETQPGEGDNAESEPGDANPFKDAYDDYAKNSPDQIDEGEMEDWAEKHDADKKNEDAKKSKVKENDAKKPEEKAKDAQEIMDKVWCAKHGIKPETLKKFRNIEAEIAPHLNELSELWQHIVYGSTRQIERSMEGHYRAGIEMDIPHLVNVYPGIVSPDVHVALPEIERARIMKQMVAQEKLIQKPDLIRVRVVGDMSGSMNEEKRHVLQHCFVLLLSSLKEFETHLNLTRDQTKSDLEVDTEGWVFGDTAKRVKRLRSDLRGEDEQVEILRSFEQLEQTIGGTYDHLALREINKAVPSSEESLIQEGKIMDIVFEVTDGASTDQSATRRAVDTLVSRQIITRAFQIGKTTQQEQEIFQAIWNSNREEPLGEIVGENVANLIPAITKLLKQYLGAVRL